MQNIAGQIQCTADNCQLRVTQLSCQPCGVHLRGKLAAAANEFSQLAGDDLHFLRVFVHCEGRIREMERALGVSYPTVKGRLAELKQKLMTAGVETPTATQSAAATAAKSDSAELQADITHEPSALDTLAELEQGNIDYQEALARIQKSKK